MERNNTCAVKAFDKRNTSIELLRLIIMFVIFVNHMISHGILQENAYALPHIGDKLMVVGGVSLWVPAAIVFVLISGYFGIKPSWKGLLKYVTMCVFYCALAYICGGGRITPLGLVKSCVFLSMQATGLWFVAAYFWLYCMSPVINAWHRSITNRQLEVYLICFTIADVAFGYLAGSALFSMPIHFVLLYSIGHYLRISERKWVKDSSVRVCFAKYAVTTVLLFAFAALLVVRKGEAHKSFEYLNPLITIQSVFILLIFTKIKIGHSHRINYLAASAFPVYLLSENIHTRRWFIDGIQYMLQHLSTPVFIIVFALACFGTYFVLLMTDKLLGHVYRPLTNQIIKLCKL